ncbi:MAG: hypothetical protein H0W64_09820 [Gammaproteobacteria bacterium]|nr:hypothetical protein [Gammaproteobacteria bacterium]
MTSKQIHKNKSGISSKDLSTDIAVIGIACRFPDAPNYQQYWHNLINNINSIREIPSDRWDIKQYYSPERDAPNKSISKWAGLLDQIDLFDAPFFNITSTEANSTDPQQRLLMEETWHCIEDAGVTLADLQTHQTSVHVGVMALDYYQRMLAPNTEIDRYACLGNYEGILANRLSYFLGLTGESESIDAACASSLIALHNAKRNLLSGKSDYAIAAGVNVICHPWKYISFSRAHMLSPNGQCKTFDASADGYVPGEGIAVMLLTPLHKALQKNYHIYGIIKGSSVHHSGKTKSITAPKVPAQQSIIEEAIREARVPSESITYVEAHGTGTSLGDPIEVEALSQAFNTKKRQFCAIGSVKTNIGHLEAAAGIAGVIKVLMMMKHKKIVKTLNIKTVNPIIDFEHSPFHLAEQLTDWQLPKNISKRRAGVSSFGFGGMGAHIILEEYRQEKPRTAPKLSFPFLLSAKSVASLSALLKEWQAYIKTEQFQIQSLADICLTLSQTRESFPYRLGRIINNKADLEHVLNEALHHKITNQTVDSLKEMPQILRLQTIPQRSYTDFHRLCSTYSLLHQLELTCLENIAALPQGNKIIGKFQTSKEASFQRLRNFVALVILSKATMMSGVKVDCLMGDGIGELAAAVTSGLLNFRSAVKWLLGIQHTIHLKRPKVNFFNSALGKVIQPFTVTTSYIKTLKALKIEASEAESILQKSRILQHNQFSFKKYLNEWKKILDYYDISLSDYLDKPQRFSPQQQTLLQVALYDSYKNLNKKWDLSGKIALQDPAAEELSHLLFDGVLTKLDVAHLLLNTDTHSLDQIAIQIQKNQHLIDMNKPYFLLKQGNQLVTEIPDVKKWLTGIFNEAITTTSPQEKLPKGKFIDIGSNFAAKGTANIKNLFPSFLVSLWQDGASINWSLGYAETAYHKVALPNYPFARERYWIENTTQKTAEPSLKSTIVTGDGKK